MRMLFHSTTTFFLSTSLPTCTCTTYMPAGVPVATVAIDGAQNAGILAAQMLATGDQALRRRITDYKAGLKAKVIRDAETL